MHLNLSKLREILKGREAWCLQSTGSQGVRRDFTTTNSKLSASFVRWHLLSFGGVHMCVLIYIHSLNIDFMDSIFKNINMTLISWFTQSFLVCLRDMGVVLRRTAVAGIHLRWTDILKKPSGMELSTSLQEDTVDVITEQCSLQPLPSLLWEFPSCSVWV